jgi:hypothetical protein
VLGHDAACAAGIATLPGDGPAFHVWRLVRAVEDVRIGAVVVWPVQQHRS